MEVKAPGIIPRKSVHEPMQTGLKALDSIDFNKGLEDLPAKKKELLDKIRTLNRTILIEVKRNFSCF